MAKRQKRDSAYQLRRLKKEHPALHDDVVNGRRSTRAAAIAAGIIKEPTPLTILKREWAKADLAQRREFLEWVKATGPRKSLKPVPPKPSPVSWRPVADGGGHLTAGAIARIQHVMNVRRLMMGGVMDELGFKRLDASLGNALRNGYAVRPAMVSALETWLDDNAKC